MHDEDRRHRAGDLEHAVSLAGRELEAAGVEQRLDERRGARLVRRVPEHDRDVGLRRAARRPRRRPQPLPRRGRRRRCARRRASGRTPSFAMQHHRRAAAPRAPAARNSALPQIAAAASGSTYGSSKRPSRNLSRRIRRADSSMRDSGDASRLDQLDEQLRQGLAAELVAARIDDLEEALRGVELLDAPGLRRPDRAVRHRRVADERPVGADDAVEAEAPAQQAGDDVLVEAEADRLELACRPAGRSTASPARCPRRRPPRTAGGGPRSGRPDRPDPCRRGSAGLRRRPAGRRRGSVSPCRRRWSARASSPWKPRMYAAVSRPTSSASSPNVPTMRAQRGSVARSAIGCSATWMPTARYSCRAMSPKSRTSSSSPRRSEPDRLGPLRERAGGPARRRVLVERVTRIGGDRHRDAEPRPLAPRAAAGCAIRPCAGRRARRRC